MGGKKRERKKGATLAAIEASLQLALEQAQQRYAQLGNNDGDHVLTDREVSN